MTLNGSIPAVGAAASLFPRRHYKKDSRFVHDLYTLTYDENESLDTVAPNASVFQKSAAIDNPQVVGIVVNGSVMYSCMRVLMLGYVHTHA